MPAALVARPSETRAARALLSAIPDGLLVLDEGQVRSVNRRLCELLGFERAELLGRTAPFPFWPPEHRHEIEAWHAALEAPGARGTSSRSATGTAAAPRRRRGPAGPEGGGERRPVVTVRDVSATRRRERRLLELSGRDPTRGSSTTASSRNARRRRAARGRQRENVALVLAELGLGGHRSGVSSAPRALVAVERLRALVRAGDELARTRESEIAWILPGTDAHAGVGAVARARTALAGLPGVALTVGICDLATAGDVLALYAFADRALSVARAQGPGGTAQYRPKALGLDRRQPSTGVFGHCCASRGGGSVTACSSERQAVCPSFVATGTSRSSSGQRQGLPSAHTWPPSPCRSTSTT